MLGRGVCLDSFDPTVDILSGENTGARRPPYCSVDTDRASSLRRFLTIAGLVVAAEYCCRWRSSWLPPSSQTRTGRPLTRY